MLVVRYASLGLLLLIALGLLFALLPSPVSVQSRGIELQDVRMKLYPKDMSAVWMFESQSIRFDPASSESVLEGVQTSNYFVNGVLKMSLSAKGLRIDGSENLSSDAAKLSIVDDACTTIDMQHIRIDPSANFTGEKVNLQSKNLTFTADSLKGRVDDGLKDVEAENTETYAYEKALYQCTAGKKLQ